LPEIKKIKSPFEAETIEGLKAGERVLISGVIYTARDAAHKRIIQAIEEGRKPPFDVNGQTIYYAGPTTSSRMDMFTTPLLDAGLKAMIGKGGRSVDVRQDIKKYGAVYFVTYGGAGALLSKAIKKAEVIAYPELAAEAVMYLEIKDFPAIVANDIHGGDLFATARDKYRQPTV